MKEIQVDNKDKKYIETVIVCGARCIFKKDGKCNRHMGSIAAIIGTDGKCVKFETTEKK